jgi:deazaflavin-dependent oxidoreductase (nitroreductase family)
VIASVLGEPRHPAWYLNLSADPKIAVTVGAKRIAVEARDAEGDEREAIWNDLIKLSPGYADYRTRTDRRIPVVVLGRRIR